MTLPNGSASATDRTLGCPGSLVLSRVHRTSADAERGHGIHAFCCAVLSGTPVETALATVDVQYRETCQFLEWQKLGGDLADVRTEVSYALDPFARTARFLGVNIARQYAQFDLGPNEIPGSLDIEGMRFDDVWCVQDLKTGHLDVEHAETNGQGLFFGAVFHLLHGAREVEFRVNRVHASGKVTLESSALYTAWEIDTFLDAYADALTRARAERRVYLAGGVPTVAVGPWCRYCEAYENCPAQAALARRMLPTAEAIEARLQRLTLPEAGRAWALAKDIEGRLDRIFEALKGRARQEPLPTRPGKQVRPIEVERSDFSRERAIELLTELGATAEQVGQLYVTRTIEQIREVNDPNAKRLPMRRAKKGAAA